MKRRRPEDEEKGQREKKKPARTKIIDTEEMTSRSLTQGNDFACIVI
jgi:hypothetical protein